MCVGVGCLHQYASDCGVDSLYMNFLYLYYITVELQFTNNASAKGVRYRWANIGNYTKIALISAARQTLALGFSLG